jgi:hypothetical protein
MAIPASIYAQINPGVVNGGGTALTLSTVFVTQNALLPSGSVAQFASSSEVGSFFGLESDEYFASVKYFLGYTNDTQTPGQLFFAPYFAADAAAWIR